MDILIFMLCFSLNICKVMKNTSYLCYKSKKMKIFLVNFFYSFFSINQPKKRFMGEKIEKSV